MSLRSATVTPVTTVPPWAFSAAASASVIEPVPPSATGQPYRWPLAKIIKPSDAVSGRSRRVKTCAAAPPNSARACSVRNQRAITVAGSTARGPNAARRIG